MDMGDNVIVINAEQVQLTGDKRQEKVFWHTGHIGGIKHRTRAQILEGKHPERVVSRPSSACCPATASPRPDGHLKVFAGPEHGMEAQQPVALDVAAMNPKNTRAN
jgi:large subunit ribosomal protein L13